MYEQKYIDTYGDAYFYNILNTSNELPYKLHSMDSVEQMKYFAFQHYLVKAYINNNQQDRCKKILKQYYKDFWDYPTKFYNSPLIANKTLDALFGESDIKKQFVERRSTFYNSKLAASLLEKRKNNTINDNELRIYYANLQKLDYLNDENSKAIAEEEIKRIINTDFSKLTTEQLSFYCQFLSNNMLEPYKFKTNVVIGKEPSKNGMLTCGFRAKDYIFMNKFAFNNIAEFTKTICHETQHSIQDYKNRTSKTNEAFEMAQHSLFQKYLDTREYDSYHKNYNYSAIELDAEKEGHQRASVYLRMFGRPDLADRVVQIRQQVLDTRNYYDYMIAADGKPVPSDTYIVENMNKIVKNHPEEINKNIVLSIFYNQDGTNKSFEEIMNGRVGVSYDQRRMFNNYINYGIRNHKLNEIDLDNKNDKEIDSFLNILSSVYGDNVYTNLNAYFEDDKNINPFTHEKYSKGQMINVTKYKMSIAYNTLSFVNDNFDTLIEPYKNQGLDSTCPIFNFIYYFRDFDFNNMKNEVLRTDPKVQEKYNEMKYQIDKITQKYNRAYMETRLNAFPDEIKNHMIENEQGQQVTFYDYCLNTMSLKLDSHQKININGQKVEIGYMLSIYADNIKKEIEEKNSTPRGR